MKVQEFIAMDREKTNKEIAISEIKKIIDTLNVSYIDKISYALDILGATSDERNNILGQLNSAVKNSLKLLRRFDEIDPQTFLAKIDKCLFEEKFDSVIINHKDYENLFIKNSDKMFKRYEPETNIEIIKSGIGGYLHGPNSEPPKQICYSRGVEIGKIIAKKIF